MAKLLKFIGSINRYLCFFILAFNVYVASTLQIPVVKPYSYGGPWKYLTIWNLVMQTVFWGCTIVSSFFSSKTKTRKVGSLDIVFQAIVLPLGLLVSSLFWGIYFIDRNLILPDAMRPFLPEWHNQSIHTLVIIGPLIEGICIGHKVPTKKQGITLHFAIMLLYLTNLHYWGLTYGNWVYPFLNRLPYPLIVCFCVFTGIIGLSCYFIAEKFQNLIRYKLN